MASVHDHTSTELNPDRKQIDDFINAIFRHAGLYGFASVRSFYEGETKPFRISPVPMARGLSFLCEVVEDDAYRAANSRLLPSACDVHERRESSTGRPAQGFSALCRMRSATRRRRCSAAAAARPCNCHCTLRRHVDGSGDRRGSR